MKFRGPWRVRPTKTFGFPKLMVDENVVSGSINVRNTRLPLWAFITTAINEGWEAVERGWSPEKHYGYSQKDLAEFLYYLLEQRGEFGRLLLLLAKVEKPHVPWRTDVWWEIKSARRQVELQLERCLDVLKQVEK